MTFWSHNSRRSSNWMMRQRRLCNLLSMVVISWLPFQPQLSLRRRHISSPLCWAWLPTLSELVCSSQPHVWQLIQYSWSLFLRLPSVCHSWKRHVIHSVQCLALRSWRMCVWIFPLHWRHLETSLVFCLVSTWFSVLVATWQRRWPVCTVQNALLMVRRCCN